MTITTTIIIISVLVLIAATLGYAAFNVVRKNVRLEEAYNSQQVFINSLKDEISATNVRLAQIDEKGLFEGDDEIGWFFDEVMKISARLSLYEDKIPTNDSSKKEEKTKK